MLSASHPSARPDVETHVLPDGSCLLFDPATSEGHVLNVVGALAWDYCDGALSSTEIAGEIAMLLPQDPHLRDEVLHVIDEFATHGLLLAAPAEATS